MTGNFIDTFRLSFKTTSVNNRSGVQLIETDYGKLRVWDTKSHKPVIINVPDGPNVIEHQEKLVEALSKNFRVICFEFPGVGFSHPLASHDYSLVKSAKIILNLMDLLKIERAALSFSCSNGFFALKAAEIAPERFIHLFLAQTPSLQGMKKWADNTIPKTLTFPIIGQLTNTLLEKKLAHTWYKYALPKNADASEYQRIALNALQTGGCFCLSGLVQGLYREANASLKNTMVPATLIWGNKDFTHRKTDKNSILEHSPQCEIIEFDDCAHFPDLENTYNYVGLINDRLKT